MQRTGTFGTGPFRYGFSNRILFETQLKVKIPIAKMCRPGPQRGLIFGLIFALILAPDFGLTFTPHFDPISGSASGARAVGAKKSAAGGRFWRKKWKRCKPSLRKPRRATLAKNGHFLFENPMLHVVQNPMLQRALPKSFAARALATFLQQRALKCPKFEPKTPKIRLKNVAQKMAQNEAKKEPENVAQKSAENEAALRPWPAH